MSSLIRIRMKAYDHKILDKEVSKIADVVRRTNATVRGPFPLPTKIKKWTVLRGPHVNKKAREQFERRTHQRILDIVNPDKSTMEELSKMKLAFGVQISNVDFVN
jgi:small subunit ribosomal protein S10